MGVKVAITTKDNVSLACSALTGLLSRLAEEVYYGRMVHPKHSMYYQRPSQGVSGGIEGGRVAVLPWVASHSAGLTKNYI